MFDSQLLKGKTIIVTGGGTGLGKSMATRFAELGANLVITSRRQNVIDETAKILREHGGKVLAISCDFREPDQVESMVEKTVEEFGEIDIQPIPRIKKIACIYNYVLIIFYVFLNFFTSDLLNHNLTLIL